jgi:hypothetical protein
VLNAFSKFKAECYNTNMNWAMRRQILVILGIILFFSAIAFLVIYPTLHKPPTCTDGIQNGNETGIDCGGSCPSACLSQVDAVSVLWARAFEVVPGRYNAVAYIVNHNQTDAAEEVSYSFRFADANNVYIGKRDGVTFIPPSGNFAIFEPAIDVGNSIPVLTTFKFNEVPNWQQVSPEEINQLKVLVSNINLTNETTSPELSATITNNSLFTIPSINVVAILYDKLGNAVSASSTYLSQLNPLTSTGVNYTWPQPFTVPIVDKEILPVYDIFSVKL